MIFIAVKFTALAAERDNWLPRLQDLTLATRGEPGNVFFDWSHSVENPNEFVLLEAFADASAKASSRTNSLGFSTLWDQSKKTLPGSPRVARVKSSSRGSQLSRSAARAVNLTAMKIMGAPGRGVGPCGSPAVRPRSPHPDQGDTPARNGTGRACAGGQPPSSR